MVINRRLFLSSAAGGLTASGLLATPALANPADPALTGSAAGRRIDRRAVVSRHDVVRTASDPQVPVQVGNGGFAFGADITGLQTFVPFATMSDWGWHSDALPPGEKPENFTGVEWETHGRMVRYPMEDPNHRALSTWLRANPHRINLGRIGLRLVRADGTDAVEADLTDRHQRLDLWTGTLHSEFTVDGARVRVRTCVHPELDALAVRISSPLVASGRLGVFLDFPYANGKDKFSAPYVGVWDQPQAHVTELSGRGEHGAVITHRLDDTAYTVGLAWRGDADVSRVDGQAHRYLVTARHGQVLELTCLFAPRHQVPVPPAEQVAQAAARQWPRFWNSGGVIDLSDSRDPRWRELERRIVLGQYTMLVNEAGDTPPQESGLANNGWYGKFHMEMLFWHAAHYALWDRWPQLNPMLDIYRQLLPSARETARDQGYAGARWPKMIDPGGRTSPGEINALLIWQQPHPIFFAELDYRAHPSRATLLKWRDIIFATADFMASYAFNDNGRYVLGPPLHVVSENTEPRTTVNPAFELSYWRFGLRVAQEWRTRLGMGRDRGWDAVLRALSPLPVQDGRYVLYEGVENMWTEYNFEHPALSGMYGWLPGDGVDLPTMRATADQIHAVWRFAEGWGWDFPMLAMNAARLGNGERAIEYLLHEQFEFKDTGLPTGGAKVPLPYFPGTGGLLYAVAGMCAGWGSGGPGPAPGFPTNGRWTVRWEGLRPAI